MKKLSALLLATPLLLAACKKDGDACNGYDTSCRLSATWSGKLYIVESDLDLGKTTQVVYQEPLDEEVTFKRDGTYQSQRLGFGDCWFCNTSADWYYADGMVYIQGEEYYLEVFTGKNMTLRYVYTGEPTKATTPGGSIYLLSYELKKDGPTEL